jgi:hypothetical protein
MHDVAVRDIPEAPGAEPGARPTAPQPGSDRLRRLLAGRPLLLPMLLLAVLVVTLNAVHVHRYTKVSPIDEVFHLDSLIEGSRLHVVQEGDQLTQGAMREIACHGSDVRTFPPCGLPHYQPSDFAWKGYNEASGHTPFFYMATGLAARLLRAVTPVKGMMTWGRLLGSLWVLAGFYLILRIGSLLRVNRWSLVLALVLVAGAPAMLHAYTTINPDVTALPAGALVTLAAVAWERRVWRLWTLPATALVCVALDPTNVLVVLLVLVYFAVRMVSGLVGVALADRRSWRDYLLGGGLAAVGPVVAMVGWRLVVALQASVDWSGSPQEVAQKVTHLAPEQYRGADAFFAIFPPILGYIPPGLTTISRQIFALAAMYVVIAALIGPLLRLDLANRAAVLTLATTVTVIAAGPLLVLQNYVVNRTYFPIGNRYGLSLLPAIAIVLASTTQSRLGRCILGFVSIGLYLTTLRALA